MSGAARVAFVDLPVLPPVLPMLAKSVKDVPDPAKFPDAANPGLLFEPKWDGFRCLVFKDGQQVELASRNTKSLTRYFPEVVEALRADTLPERCVLDGELIVAIGDRLDFDRLQERIHPADSRVPLSESRSDHNRPPVLVRHSRDQKCATASVRPLPYRRTLDFTG